MELHRDIKAQPKAHWLFDHALNVYFNPWPCYKMVKSSFSIWPSTVNQPRDLDSVSRSQKFLIQGLLLLLPSNNHSLRSDSFVWLDTPSARTLFAAVISNPVTSLENQLAAIISCYPVVQQSLEKDEVFLMYFWCTTIVWRQTLFLLGEIIFHFIQFCGAPAHLCTSHWGEISGLLVLALKLHEAGWCFTDWEKQSHYQNL